MMKHFPYGYCPKCKAPGLIRERRPNGNDRCVNMHVYRSADAIPDETEACGQLRLPL